ncbi:hypothetical protein LR1_07320 [Lacticaseibacillus rhamnosus DSM 20021 = JCM 1136 = NBRC 3425]|nr:hypothetical protein LR1_07320 [Lacticaseibacillus rhamnosus DSM 20021 = JCM 1136 = NBRC 3425]
MIIFKACANDARAKDWQAVKQGQRRELSQDCQPKKDSRFVLAALNHKELR